MEGCKVKMVNCNNKKVQLHCAYTIHSKKHYRNLTHVHGTHADVKRTRTKILKRKKTEIKIIVSLLMEAEKVTSACPNRTHYYIKTMTKPKPMAPRHAHDRHILV